VQDNSRVILLGRMALVALVIGSATAIAATERVTFALVLAGASGWAFVPLLQALTGLLLLRGSRGPRLPSLERYFALHWPWSLWIIAFSGAVLLLPPRLTGVSLVATAVVPLLWTVWLLLDYCRADLGFDRRTARRRVALHQAVTYGLVVGYVSLAVALWPRVVGTFA
jgi:hypothetical protein